MSTSVLWDQQQAGDLNARSALIEQYVPLVRYVVGRMGLTLPPTLDFEDIVSFGIIGLIDAIERFEPERGLRFGTYAIQRIRGAILDELRTLDWAPRTVRARMRQLDKASSILSGRLHRDPTLEELAAELDISVGDVDRIIHDAVSTVTTSLDVPAYSDDARPTSVGEYVPDLGELPDMSLEMRENLECIAHGLDALDPNARALMALYYFEGLTFTQIGDLLGVTESRVCQIHAESMRELRRSAVG